MKTSYVTVTDQLVTRILRRVNQNGPIPTDPSRPLITGCWLWTGGCFPAGYGCISIGNESHLVHRLVYVALVGSIPTDYDIDHVCRVRACCRPDHLEAVTREENIHRAKREFCKHGHHMNARNTGPVKGKPHQRVCRACAAEKTRRYRARQVSNAS